MQQWIHTHRIQASYPEPWDSRSADLIKLWWSSSEGSEQSQLCDIPILLLLFSHSVMSNSLRPHGLLYARLLCPSLSPGVFSNSYPLNWWSYATISSSVTLFSSCIRSFPASGSFPMRQLIVSGSQSIGASVSVSTSPSNEYIQG